MKKKTSRTIKQIADEIGIASDEVLIRLWDAGLNEFKDSSDRIRGSQLQNVRRLLGLHDLSKIRSVSYWIERLDVSEEELKIKLKKFNIELSSGTQKIPKGSVRRLKQIESKEQNIVPQVTAKIERALNFPDSPPEFDLEQLGHEKPIRFLEIREVEAIHNLLVEDFYNRDDPLEPPGVRDYSLLESALFRPQTSWGIKNKYLTVEMVAAALLHSLILDHPFHNGNKRTALVSMLTFLDENGLLLVCDDNSVFKMVLQVAQHKLVKPEMNQIADREVMKIAEWINSNSRVIEQGDRPIPYRELRRILTDFDCKFENVGSGGGKVNITRTVSAESRFRWGKTKEDLFTQIHVEGEGREVAVNTIKKIRSDLRLDDEHGIDSSSFYKIKKTPAAEFIKKYRKALSRLAKL